MSPPRKIAAWHRQGGVYKPLSKAGEKVLLLLESPTPTWLDRDYPYVAPPDLSGTLKELAFLVDLVSQREAARPFLEAADGDLVAVFAALSAELGLDIDVDPLYQIRDEARVLIAKMKWQYNRPRPYQVAAEHGIPFEVMDSKTAHTPAYPSGHTVQSYLVASYLSELAPQHRKVFMELAHKISWSRALAGYHWPSDLIFGKDIYRHIVSPSMPASVRLAKNFRFDVGSPGRVAARWVESKTYTVNKGDAVWYGKYKNQRGLVKDFGMGAKGDPTITVEQLPSPSARKPKKKSPKEINLFKIRPRKKDEHDEVKKEAASKARSKKEVPKADGSGTTTVYEYGPRQVAQRNKEKAARIEALRKKMGDLRQKARGDLTSKDPQVRLTALAVCLMDETYGRVGNEGSAKEGHYGVTNWTADHIKLGSKTATIQYTGKSGVKQKKTVSNSRVLKALRDAVKGKGKGDKVLCEGDECDILAKDVNAYLKPFDVTAKDIRGLHANEEMRRHLAEIRKAGAELPQGRKDRDKTLKGEFDKALKAAAAAVGHEASTLKNQYLVPSMEVSYMQDGTVIDRLDKTATKSRTEKEEEEAERLVRPSPKYKPPRRDLERGRVRDPDEEQDADTKQDQKDRSLNYKDSAARVGLRFLMTGAAERQRSTGSPRTRKREKTQRRPEMVSMWSTEANRIVPVSAEAVKANPGKYTVPTDEQKAQAPGPKVVPDPAPEPESSKPPAPAPAPTPMVPRAPIADAVDAARKMYKEETEGVFELWDRDRVKAALKKEFEALLGDDFDEAELAFVGDADDQKAFNKGRGALINKHRDKIRAFDKGSKEMRAELAKKTKEFAPQQAAALKDLSNADLLSVVEAFDKASKEVVKDVSTSAGRVALRQKAKFSQKVLDRLGAEGKNPTPEEIATAIATIRAAKALEDPANLDPTDSLTSYTTEPFKPTKAEAKKYEAKMLKRTLSSMKTYRGFDKQERESHQKALQKQLEEMTTDGQQDSERYAQTIAQMRGLTTAVALEDGEDAKGVSPTMQAMLKAADQQGRLDDFVSLNIKGAAEGDKDAQHEFRKVMDDLPDSDLFHMISGGKDGKALFADDHPAMAALEALNPTDEKGKKRYEYLSPESKSNLREMLIDAVVGETLFTDASLEKANPDSTVRQLRKKKRKRKNPKTQSFAEALSKMLREMGVLKGDFASRRL